MNGVLIRALINAVSKYVAENGADLLRSALVMIRDRLPEGTSELFVMLLDLIIDALPVQVSTAEGDDLRLAALEAELDNIVAKCGGSGDEQ